MSKVTLLNNKSEIIDNIDKIRDMAVEHDKSRLEEYIGGIVFSETLQKQYTMMREDLNLNSIRKRYFTNELKNRELLNTYYQHMYMHNHIAFEDEVFEAYDAIGNLLNSTKQDKIDLCKLLVLEELIDVYHFLLEYTCLLKEHFLMQIECTKQNEAGKDFTVRDLERYLTVDSNFGIETHDDGCQYNIFDFLDFEGKHIASDIFCPSNIDKFYGYLSTTQSDQFLFELLRLNREFVRNCNFKDWKNYSVNFYDIVKIASLTDITRKMYYLFIKTFVYYIDFVNVLYDDEYPYSGSDYLDALYIIYGIYTAKRSENIRRQHNDPRYTGKNEGSVVGIEV